MLKDNINDENEKEVIDEIDASCDCCDEGCDCGDCKKCSGETKDIEPITDDEAYINEYSDGNIEIDSSMYGKAKDANFDENDNYN
ncbi:MAG: hypothetical protein WCT40_02045 [Candidatus Magasanikbacteria bacterium]|jgi:hypothetical protein